MSRGFDSRFAAGAAGAARSALLKLAASGPAHENVTEEAMALLQDVFECRWEFCENEGAETPDTIGWPVSVLGQRLGVLRAVGMSSDWRCCEVELAELGTVFGLCLLIADQGRAIAEMENASADMLRFAPDALFVLDESGVVLMVNRRALELLERGEHEVVGRTLQSLLGVSALLGRSHWRDAITTGEKLEAEVSTSGGPRLLSLGLSEISGGQVLCLARDITKERLAQLAVRRAQRAVMLGQTVEYLVHEVNNPLSALLSSTANERRQMRELMEKLERLESAVDAGEGRPDLRRDILETASRLKAAADTAHTNAERIRSTMATLRQAHRRLGEISSEWTDVGYEIGLAIGIIEQEMSAGDLPRIQLSREIGPLPRVLAPPLVLAETVAAVLRNAAQFAAHEGREGRAWVRAVTVQEQAIIEVEDSGPGIPLGHVERVFMPFFTTRAEDGALGLGLAQAKDAVQRLGGALAVVASSTGRGACLRLSLPIERAQVF